MPTPTTNTKPRLRTDPTNLDECFPLWRETNSQPDWRRYVSEPTLRRGDDGLSNRMARLKALSNSLCLIVQLFHWQYQRPEVCKLILVSIQFKPMEKEHWEYLYT